MCIVSLCVYVCVCFFCFYCWQPALMGFSLYWQPAIVIFFLHWQINFFFFLYCLTTMQCLYLFCRCNITKSHSVQTSLSVIWCRSSDDGEGGAVPDPSVVDDNVGRVGDEWSVVCVELARPVRRMVVV